MLKTLWFLDAALLMVALGMAFLTTGQDAAGRAILWFFPVVMALGLGGSWLLERAGSHKTAVALGLVAPLLGATVFFGLGRSLIEERRRKSGVAYWSDRKVQRLAAAMAAGDTAAVRVAAADADLNAVGKDGTTPLTFAIAHHPPSVSLLIELGANPNLKTPGVMSPLEQALDAAGPAFEALLEGGADANARDDYGVPVLFATIRAPRRDRYDQLIAHGADVRQLDANGHSALMAAVGARQWKMALDVLTRGVDPSIVAPDGASLATILERVSRDTEGDADYAALKARLAAPNAAPR